MHNRPSAHTLALGTPWGWPIIIVLGSCFLGTLLTCVYLPKNQSTNKSISSWISYLPAEYAVTPMAQPQNNTDLFDDSLIFMPSPYSACAHKNSFQDNLLTQKNLLNNPIINKSFIINKINTLLELFNSSMPTFATNTTALQTKFSDDTWFQLSLTEPEPHLFAHQTSKKDWVPLNKKQVYCSTVMLNTGARAQPCQWLQIVRPLKAQLPLFLHISLLDELSMQILRQQLETLPKLPPLPANYYKIEINP